MSYGNSGQEMSLGEPTVADEDAEATEAGAAADSPGAPAEPSPARWSSDLEGLMRRAAASARRTYVSRERERAAADRAAITATVAAASAAAEDIIAAWPSLPVPDVSSMDITEWPGASAAPANPEHECPPGVVRPVPPATVQVALKRPRGTSKQPADASNAAEKKEGGSDASSASDSSDDDDDPDIGGIEAATISLGGRWIPGCPMWLLPQHPRPPPYKSWTGVKRNHFSMETGQRMFYTEAETGETVPLSDDEGAVVVSQQDARALDGLARCAADAAIVGALAAAEEAGEDIKLAIEALAAALGVSEEALSRRAEALDTPLRRSDPPQWAPRSAVGGEALDSDFHGAFCRMCRTYGCRVHEGSHPRPVTGPMGPQEEAARERPRAFGRRPAVERPPPSEPVCAPCGPRCYRLFLNEGERAEEAARVARAEGRRRAAEAEAAKADEEGEDEEEAGMGAAGSGWRTADDESMGAEGGGTQQEGTPMPVEVTEAPQPLGKEGASPARSVPPTMPLDCLGAVLTSGGASSGAAERAAAAAREAAAAGAPARASPPRTEPPTAAPTATPMDATLAAADAAAVAEETARPWAPWEDAAVATGLEVWGRHPCRIAALVGTRSCAAVRARMAALAPSPRAGSGGEAPFSPDQAPARRGRRKGGFSVATKVRKKATVVQERLNRLKEGTEGAVWEQFSPCDCTGPCGPSCPCAGDANFCEKFCGCDPARCGNRFTGCRCRCGSSLGRRCTSRQCPCAAAGRECDPDLCRLCAPTLTGTANPGHQCNNFRLRLGQKRRVLQGLSGVAGWGAFLAGPAARKDDFIGEYCGELVDQGEADRRGKVYDRDDNSYLFNLNQEWVIDARQSGNKLRFANHSAVASCRTEILMVDGDHRVAVLANRDLQPGEELFYDYRYDHMVAPDWALDGGGGGGGSSGRGRGGARGRGGRGR